MALRFDDDNNDDDSIGATRAATRALHQTWMHGEPLLHVVLLHPVAHPMLYELWC